MWEFYLAGCEVAFRYMGQMVFQMQIAKRSDAVPLTRDYIIDFGARASHAPIAGPADRRRMTEGARADAPRAATNRPDVIPAPRDQQLFASLADIVAAPSRSYRHAWTTGTRNVTPLRQPGDPAAAIRPHNYEAEQALLGAILANNRVFDRVTEFLRPDHFADALHGRIYEARRQADRARPDRQRGDAEEPVRPGPGARRDRRRAISGAARRGSVVTIINAEDYGRAIHDLYLRRELIDLGEEIVNDPFPRSRRAGHRSRSRRPSRSSSTWPRPARPRAASAVHRRPDRRDHDGRGRASSATASIDRRHHRARRSRQEAGRAAPLRSGDPRRPALHGQDRARHQHRLQRRPGLSRRAIADGAPRSPDGAMVAFFSLEMSAEQLATRILAEETGTPRTASAAARSSARGFRPRSSQAASELAAAAASSSTTRRRSASPALRTRARRLKRQHGLGLIVVDYLQLHAPARRRRAHENRVQEVSEITRGLKAIAKELDVPVLALSQLSRAVEQREDKRPQLADLRESGSIEQDADVVMFIFREEYYLERGEPKQRDDESDEKFNERHDDWQRALRAGPRHGRGHHRQAAPRPDRHRRAVLRGQGDQVRQSGAPTAPSPAVEYDRRMSSSADSDAIQARRAGAILDDRSRRHRRQLARPAHAAARRRRPTTAPRASRPMPMASARRRWRRPWPPPAAGSFFVAQLDEGIALRAVAAGAPRSMC